MDKEMTDEEYDKLRDEIVVRHQALYRILQWEHTGNVHSNGSIVSTVLCDCIQTVMGLHGYEVNPSSVDYHCRIWTDFKRDHSVSLMHKEVIKAAWRKKAA